MKQSLRSVSRQSGSLAIRQGRGSFTILVSSVLCWLWKNTHSFSPHFGHGFMDLGNYPAISTSSHFK